MKINFIQISNILSFKYYESIEDAPKIEFNDDLNILIGQNGSGKSTALEVINFIFKKVIFKPFGIQEDQYLKKETLDMNNKKNILVESHDNSYTNFRLGPNWDTDDSNPQKILIEIELDSIDEKNIAHLNEHNKILNELASEYTQRNIPNIQLSKERKLTINISLKPTLSTFECLIPDNENARSIFTYLKDYNFHNELITLYNRENQTHLIENLYESFILISGYRNYHSFNSVISLSAATPNQQIKETKNQEFFRSINAGERAEPAIFYLVGLIIAKKHFELNDTKLDIAECEEKANQLPFLASINERLCKIHLKCKIKLIDKAKWHYTFEFIDIRRDRAITNINSLSAGQKAIVHLIFEAYGRGDLKGGLIIIDEPEIHLHHQFQHEYLDIIKDINKELKNQYILVTHSESLITSETIRGVKRFALDQNNHTWIKSPSLTTEQTNLIKILDNTRSTYAFFAKKIILVEGDTDRFFFKAVLKILHPELEQEIAVLDIGGKDNYKKWKLFFEDFGLTVYFIGDFDNLFTIDNPIKEKKANHIAALKQKKLDALAEKEKNDLEIAFDNFTKNPMVELWEPISDFYKRFLGLSKSDNQAIFTAVKKEFTAINDTIEDQYPNKIYILKSGAIEDYTQTEHKDLMGMITFCEKSLKEWLQNNSGEAKEIKDIMNKITDTIVTNDKISSASLATEEIY